MKSRFTNIFFYWIMITMFAGILILSVYLLIFHYKPILFLALIVQSVLLMLIFTKHKYVKIGIIIWSLVVLIIGNGLYFLSVLLKYIGTELQNKNIEFTSKHLQDFITNLIQLTIGILIFRYAYKTIELVKDDDGKNIADKEGQ